MLELTNEIQKYLSYCKNQRKLDGKTIKAYRIDLGQFATFMAGTDGRWSRDNLTAYIGCLHGQFRPKSAKRKIASLQAFFGYLEYEEIFEPNPFAKLKVKFQEPALLPRTVPLDTIQAILRAAYAKKAQALSERQQQEALRDIAILEILFATGLRVSELCALDCDHINLIDGTILIYGKGAKERIVSIENPEVLTALRNYAQAVSSLRNASNSFFLNRHHKRISDQSVRLIIKRHTELAGSSQHITPHMFRHSFATLLLEEDVDIRYIQQLLGHSSITTTQIYTHVAASKQRAILTAKHPRNKIHL